MSKTIQTPSSGEHDNEFARLVEIRPKTTRVEDLLYGSLAPVVRLAGQSSVALTDAGEILRMYTNESRGIDGWTVAEDGKSPASQHTLALERAQAVVADLQHKLDDAVRDLAAIARDDAMADLVTSGQTG
jgi:hypothetical protein